MSELSAFESNKPGLFANLIRSHEINRERAELVVEFVFDRFGHRFILRVLQIRALVAEIAKQLSLDSRSISGGRSWRRPRGTPFGNSYKLSSVEVSVLWLTFGQPFMARKLEAQLDEQMTSYRRLISLKSVGSQTDIESGIERLLKQLQQVNLQMQTWVSSGGSQIISHTLTRHKEILQDLTQEFYKLQSSLRAKQERSSLLLDFRDFDRAKAGMEDGADTEQHALLKEQAAIGRSSGQMDNVISQAQATLGALALQRSTFGGITTKISNVSSRLPTVNHILSSIKRKKSMDTIILSLVASVCTFLMLMYWLSK